MPTALRQHKRQYGLRKRHHAKEINGHQSLVNRQVRIGNGATLSDARILKHEIDPAEALVSRFYVSGQTRRVGHVHRQNKYVGCGQAGQSGHALKLVGPAGR